MKKARSKFAREEDKDFDGGSTDEGDEVKRRKGGQRPSSMTCEVTNRCPRA